MKATEFEATLRRQLPVLSRVISVIITLAGAVVFIGWGLNIQALIRLIPTNVVMNPMTAFAFILTGLSLWLRGRADAPGRPWRRRDWLGSTLAALVALIGATKLCDYIFGFTFHIDRVFFPVTLSQASGHPISEMAPNSSVCFLFAGLALLFMDSWRPRGFLYAQVVTLATGVIALFALTGYAYRVLVLYQVAGAEPMSLDTAFGFSLFSAGLLAARPGRGLMSIVTSRSTGGIMARRLLPMAILMPFLLGALLLWGEHRGRYGGEFALSFFAAATIFLFTALIWWNAKLLHLADLERARAEEQLRQTSANLARSNTDLQQFAYVASHDLFEPLRMITSYLQLLAARCGKQLDQQAREFIGFALDGAKRMDDLIRDLLAYSRVEARGRSFKPTDCAQALQAALANLKIAIEESGAVIVTSPMPTVLADAVQITQVFQNLIGNAIKFHGEKPPRIEVGSRPQGEEWLFFVRDNGIGIDPQQFDRLFVIFQRLHTRQEYPGTGIGLAICKRIVERHGGRVWLESAPGKGATFFFTLPMMPATPPAGGGDVSSSHTS